MYEYSLCIFEVGNHDVALRRVCLHTISNARKLLAEGKTSEIQGFTSKNGKLFNARLKLEGDKVVFDFK